MSLLAQIWKWFSVLVYVAFSPDVRKVVNTVKEKIKEGNSPEEKQQIASKICEGVGCSADLKRD